MLVKEKLKQWKKLLIAQLTPTKICKICYKNIDYRSFHNLLNEDLICSDCLNNLNPNFRHFIFEGVKALRVYVYKDMVRNNLFFYKQCLDYELKDTFLKMYQYELKEKYMGFTLVFAPSALKNIEKRGFKHVHDMFAFLNFEELDILKKDENDEMQHLKNYFARKEVGKHIFLNENTKTLKGKKILLVDDVITTGSTLKACLNLLKSLNPDKIEILVMAKREMEVQLTKDIEVIK